MTEEKEAGSGPSTGTKVAIATAIITAITTISVAFINRPQPNVIPKPDPVIQPEPVKPIAPDDVLPPLEDIIRDAPKPAPVIPLASIGPANIGGQWHSVDGSEQLFINQSGASFSITDHIITPNGPATASGAGSIIGRVMTWTANINGLPIELECKGKVTSNGQSIQATCEGFDEKNAGVYVR
jgi:hypothetical protein